MSVWAYSLFFNLIFDHAVVKSFYLWFFCQVILYSIHLIVLLLLFNKTELFHWYNFHLFTGDVTIINLKMNSNCIMWNRWNKDVYLSQWENTWEMNIRFLIHGVNPFSDMILLTISLPACSQSLSYLHIQETPRFKSLSRDQQPWLRFLILLLTDFVQVNDKIMP
jgi:hypothetical protein